MIEYTDYKYRVQTLKNDEGLNWLFLLGGPGIGSEYLADNINLPGSKVMIDFPRDGSNRVGETNIINYTYASRGFSLGYTIGCTNCCDS